MLEVNTIEQVDFIIKILESEFPKEYNDFTFWSDGKGVTIECPWSYDRIDLSFDTMAEIVDYLREQNKTEVK